jgi:acyl carrier protein
VKGENTFLDELASLMKVSDLSSIDPDADLFNLSLLDSFGVVVLVELLDKHGVPVLEINLEDLETINSLNKIRSLVSPGNE